MKSIRIWLLFFIISLLISGITAFAPETGLRWLLSIWPANDSALYRWIQQSYLAVKVTNEQFPSIAYGYDWLAFAHIVIATVFIGPLRNPIRNVWVIQFGCIACAMIIPLALIAGPLRQIPMFWQLIDCSFGVVGIIPLIICLRKIRQLGRKGLQEREHITSLKK